MSRLLGCTLAALPLALAACSLQQPSATRLSPPAPLPQMTAASPLDAGARPGVISLDSLRPISTRPSFPVLAQAVELGDDPKALEAIQRQLQAVEAEDPELQRLELWLGYAYRKRSNALQALLHFDAAGRKQWALAGYAQLGSAEALLALGRSHEALHRLAAVAESEPLASDVQLLRAQVLAQTGRVTEAIPLWRSYVARTPSTEPRRAQVSLTLAEALISLASSQSSRPEPPRFEPSEPVIATDTLQQEAFELLDPLRNRALDVDAQQRAVDLRQALVSVVFAGQPSQQQQCKLGDRINALESLVELRESTRATAIAQSLLDQLEPGHRYSVDGCRILFCTGQLKLRSGESTEASAAFESIADHCTAPDDLVARALFQSGRRRLARGDMPAAIARFEALQKRFPQHRLADDARLKAAHAYRELGAVSTFIELIQRMAEDFPAGDQVPEALFQLALHRMTKGDWEGAASVLANLGRLPCITRREDPEQAERQQYFMARTLQKLGQTEAAVEQWAALVRERPFSYYMLLANGRLSSLAPDRARQAREVAQQNRRSPFEVPYQPELESAGFERAIELMALGEMDAATHELKHLNLPKDIEPELLWAKAAFEAAAGELKSSQRIVRERFQAWPRFWPTGAWQEAWRLAFPRPFEAIVRRESARTGVPAALVYAVMREESMFDHEAVSPADAHGLMQLIVPTAQRAARDLGISANARSLKRPEVNIALGCQVLKDLLRKFSNRTLLAIAGYNAGPGRPIRWMKERPGLDLDIWVEAIPFFETRTYVKHVLASWAAYTWLYEGEQLASVIELPERLSE